MNSSANDVAKKLARIAAEVIEPYYNSGVTKKRVIPMQEQPAFLPDLVASVGIDAVISQIVRLRSIHGKFVYQVAMSWFGEDAVATAEIDLSVNVDKEISEAVNSAIRQCYGLYMNGQNLYLNNRNLFKTLLITVNTVIKKRGADSFMIFEWNRGVWVNGERPLLDHLRAIYRSIGYTMSDGDIKRIKDDQLAMAKTLPNEFAMNEEWLAIKGAHLNMRTGERTSVTDEHYVSRYVGLTLNDHSETPVFDKYLGDVFPNDPETQRFHRMSIGSTLAPVLFQNALINIAPGRSGRGVKIGLIGLGLSGNVTGISLELLGKRFGLSALYSVENAEFKLANMPSESKASSKDGRVYIDAEALKATSGGESTMSMELKGVNHFDVKFRGIYQEYSYNGKPILPDEVAIRDRLRVTYWPRTFTGEERNINLLQELKPEVDAIFTKAYEEFREWVDAGNTNLPESPAMAAAKADLLGQTDSIVVKFLKSGVLVERPGARIDKAEFVRRLEDFADEYGESTQSYKGNALWNEYKRFGRLPLHSSKSNGRGVLKDVAWAVNKKEDTEE